MKKLINKFRIWLLIHLITYDEKWLLYRTIDDRIDKLYKLRISEKWIDYNYITKDIKDLKTLQKIIYNINP